MSKWSDIFGKLNQRQFEVKEEYWEDLEKQLDQHDEKKRNIRLGWFTGIALFLLALTGGTAYVLQPDEHTIPLITQEENNDVIIKELDEKNAHSVKDKEQAAVTDNQEGSLESTTKQNVREMSAKQNSKKDTQISNHDGVVATKAPQNENAPSVNKETNPGTELKKDPDTPENISYGEVMVDKSREDYGTSGKEKEEPTLKMEAPKESSSIDDEQTISTDEKGVTENLQTENAYPRSDQDNEENKEQPKGLVSNYNKGAGDENAGSFDEKPDISTPFRDDSNEKQELTSGSSEYPVGFEMDASGDFVTEKAETTPEKISLKVKMPNIPSLGLKPVAEMDLHSFSKEEEVRKIPSRLEFRIGLFGGGYYTGKLLQSTEPSMSEYIQRRKEEESGTTGYQAGLDVSLGFGRWSVGTGLNYYQQGEVTNYKSEFLRWIKEDSVAWDVKDNSYWDVNTRSFHILVDSSYWTYRDTTIFHWNSSTGSHDTTIISLHDYQVYKLDSTWFHLRDSAYVEEFDSVQQVFTDSTQKTITDATNQPEKRETRVSYFEIPLFIGYEIPISRFTLMMQTGIGVGFLSGHELVYLKNDISGLEEIQSERINKIVWNYRLRMSLLYHYNEHLALNLQPSFRMNMNSVIRNEEFTQRYWNAGVNIGVFYRF